jgi:hypothetical protein
VNNIELDIGTILSTYSFSPYTSHFHGRCLAFPQNNSIIRVLSGSCLSFWPAKKVKRAFMESWRKIFVVALFETALIKKKTKIFLIYKEIQRGIFAYFLIY